MHPGDLLSKKLVYGLLALGLLCGPHPAVGWCADEPKADPAPTKEESVPPASRKQGPRQPGDDSLRDLDPPGGETSPLARSPGAAHFLAGKIHEKRAARDDDELDKAIDCYRRAIEADPKLIQAYSALVKWYLVKQNRADAKKYALMAGEQSPLGIEIIRRYAMEVALRQNELPEAITVLTDALKLPQLDQKSLQYWLVQRDLGKFLHLNQQPQEAAEHYQQLFATVQAKDGPLSPTDRKELLSKDAGGFYDELGKVFLEAEQPELALEAFREAAKFRATGLEVYAFNVASVFYKTGKLEQSLAELQIYFDAQLQSKGREAYLLLANLLKGLKRSPELVPRLEELVQKDPRNSTLLYFLGQQYLQQEQWDKAEELYKNPSLSPKDPRNVIGMLRIYRQQRKISELFDAVVVVYALLPPTQSEDVAMKIEQEIQEAQRQFTAEFKALGKDKAVVELVLAHANSLMKGDDPELKIPQAYVMAKLAAEAKNSTEVSKFYRFVLGSQNSPTPGVYKEWTDYLLSDAHQYKEAIEVLNEAVTHPSPDFARARPVFYYFLSYAYEFDGQTEQALDAVHAAQKLAPNFEWIFQEGWIHSHAEHWAEGKKILEDLIQKLKSNPEQLKLVQRSRFLLSNIHVQQGEMEEGEKILLDVLKEDEDNAQANNDLGYLWADQGKNLEQAKKMIEKALKADPDNAAYLDSLGWVLFKLDQLAPAREALVKACELLKTEDPTLYEHLGDCQAKLGEAAEAQVTWKKSKEINNGKPHRDEKLGKRLDEKLK